MVMAAACRQQAATSDQSYMARVAWHGGSDIGEIGMAKMA